jgi:hypothetical protein
MLKSVRPYEVLRAGKAAAMSPWWSAARAVWEATLAVGAEKAADEAVYTAEKAVEAAVDHWIERERMAAVPCAS